MSVNDSDTGRKNSLLIFLCMIMDICWMTAWALFLVDTTTSVSFPFITAMIFFISGYAAAVFFDHGNHRMIWPLLANVTGILSASAAFLSSADVNLFPGSVSQWYPWGVLVVFAALFWHRGFCLAKKKLDYQTTCHHFDLGFSIFFSLFLIMLLIDIKSEIDVSIPACFYLMLLFITAGPAALFVSFHPGKFKGRFVGGYKIYSILISLAMFILSFCLIWGLAFHPLLTKIAQSGTTAFQDAAGPLAPYLTTAIRFIFGLRSKNNQQPPQQAEFDISEDPLIISSHESVDGLVMLYIAAIVFSIIFTVLSVYAFYKILNWLTRKNNKTSNRISAPDFLKSIISLFRLFTGNLNILIRFFNRKTQNSRDGFSHLSSWGQRSGIKKHLNETPSEYCSRLAHHYDILKNEIFTIHDAFTDEVYAQKNLEPLEIYKIKTALKTIHKPTFWILRIKTIFLYDAQDG